MKKFPGAILIIDDDEHVVLTSHMILKQHFENIETLASPVSLESKLKQVDYHVVLLDMNFKTGATSGNEGLYWMNRIQILSPLTQVVFQTAYGDIGLAVRSMKGGAVDFLAKPWDKEDLVSTMLNAYKQASVKRKAVQNGGIQTSTHDLKKELFTFIAASPGMLRVMQTIDQVASTNASILILGENGTGKEVVAHTIHRCSNRANYPFVHIDLGSIPAALFESEMFGHEKGAYTDAKEERMGKIEMADHGTLFLDEIGNLPTELQVKLLTVLQDRKLTRIGSNKVIDLDFRIICASNAPIKELISKGLFRQDLFYRIRTVEIVLPALRERKEDIPLLIKHFLEQYIKLYGKQVIPDPALHEQLTRYEWPGNVRELQHAIERAVILTNKEVITIDDFQLGDFLSGDILTARSFKLSEIEKETIIQALHKFKGNLTHAANELGIGRSTLYRKINEYGIEIPGT
jgi:DNA-binding NtrC family response regulator